MALNVENFLSFAADVSLKAFLLAGVAAAALLVFRVRNANLRHRVWLAVLTGMLVLPFCVGRIPGLRIRLGLIAREVPCEVVPTAMPVAEMGPTPAMEPAFAEESPPAAEPMAESPGANSPAPLAQNNTPEMKRWLPSISIPQLIFTAYLLGVAWFVTRLAIGVRQAHRLICQAKRIELSARDCQLVGSTEVRESAMIRVPLSLGWWRGMILLPSDWQSWNESMLRAALLHEKEHVARSDQRVALLAELNRALYWFHPVAWFLRRRLSTLAEAACDDAVIASTDDPASYARNLLAIAGRLADRPWRLGPAVVAMARTPRIEQRIEAVLDESRPLARRLGYGAAGSVIVAAVALVLFAAGLQADEDRAATPAGFHDIPTFAPAGLPAPVPAADQLILSAGPVQEIKAEGGRRVFQFPVAVPKGRSFSVSFNNWPRGGNSSANLVEEQERDKPSTATLQFAFTDDSKAAKRDDVLLSDEKYLEVSLKADGCFPNDVATIASVPLHNVPAGDRKLVLVSPDSPLAKTPWGTRLLLITRKDQDPKTEAEVEKIEPRGELIVSLVPQEKPKPEPTPQELMAEALRGATSGIGTFFVRYQQLITPELKPLGVEAVRKIVADAAAKDLRPNYGSSDTDPDQSHQFASDVLRAMVKDDILKVLGDKPFKLRQSDFRMVGMKTFSIDGTRPEETPTHIRSFDGNLDLEYDTFNHQLNVINAGQSRFSPPQPGIDSFRSTLQLSNFRFVDPEKKLAEAGVEQLSEGRVRFKMRPIEAVATPHNGFVERLTLDRGEPGATEVFQFGPVEFPGRLTFPRSRLEFDFERGKLRSASVVTNDDIKVNEGFRDSDFAIKLPAGTTVVDYRQNEARPDTRKLDAEVPDAAAYIAKQDDAVPAKAQSSAGKPTEKQPAAPVAVPAKAEATVSTASTKPADSAMHQVRGRVVMKVDGRPVPKAEVHLFAWKVKPDRYENHKAVTDENGDFVFDKIGEGSYQASAFFEDYSSRQLRFRGQPVDVPADAPITLTLEKMPAISIEVVSKADGKPVADALVHVQCDINSDRHTDEHGETRLRNLTHETWKVEVSAKGFAKQDQAISLTNSDTATTKFELEPGGTVSGVVNDVEGKPIAGVGISVFRIDFSGGQLQFLRTDKQGKFRFESLPLNQALQLMLSKDGFSDLNEALSLTAPKDVEKELTIELKPRPFGGSVRGTIRDSNGKPIADAEVLNEGRASRDIRKTTTDANGNYELKDVFIGSVGYELIAKARHFAPQRRQFSPGTAEQPTTQDITLAAGQQIRGRVVDESGKPVREAQVYFSDGNRGGNMNFGGGMTTEADGRFEFDSLPGDTTFNVSAIGYPGVQHLKLPLGGNEDVIVTLKSEGVIKGRVVDAATGKPISPFNVQLTFSPDRKPTDVEHGLDGERATSPEGERITNLDGTFLLNNLAPTMPLQVTVTADGYEHVVERRIDAAPATEAKVVEFRLLPVDQAKTAAIRGHFVTADGKPVGGVELRLISAREINPAGTRREIYNNYPLDWQTIRRGYADRATGISQYISTVSRPDGSFEFPAVKPAVATEIAYWGDGISRGRLMNVEKLDAASHANLTIKAVTPGMVRGAIDRDAATKIGGVQLYPRGRNDVEYAVDSYEAETARGDTSYEIRNVPPGDYDLVVVGERIRTGADGFTYHTMERRRITVRSAETATADIAGADLHPEALAAPTPASSN